MDRTKQSGSAARVLTLAALALAATGCYQHTYTIGAGAPGGALVHDEWRHHWLGGLVDPNSELELRQVCPSGDATIDNEVTVLKGLVRALTGAIYSPTTVRIRCSGTRADLGIDVELDATDVARIVADPAFLRWVADVHPDRFGEVDTARLHRSAD
jgi:hypothetical protein